MPICVTGSYGHLRSRKARGLGPETHGKKFIDQTTTTISAKRQRKTRPHGVSIRRIGLRNVALAAKSLWTPTAILVGISPNASALLAFFLGGVLHRRSLTVQIVANVAFVHPVLEGLKDVTFDVAYCTARDPQVPGNTCRCPHAVYTFELLAQPY